MYLVAVIDWHSRYVAAWQLSTTLDGPFCLRALEQALAQAQPEIFTIEVVPRVTVLLTDIVLTLVSLSRNDPAVCRDSYLGPARLPPFQSHDPAD